MGSSGTALATFALYWRQPHVPDEHERAVIARVQQYVRIAIERTREREELRQSEARLRSIFDFVPVSLWEEDWTGVIAMIDDLRAQEVADFAGYFERHPEFVALARGKTLHEAEMSLLTVRGRRLHALLRLAFPLPGATSGRVLLSVMDITARREAEERFRVVAQATNDVVWDHDLVEGDVWCSEGMRTHFGIDPAEMAGGTSLWNARIHPDDRAHFLELVARSVEGRALELEAEYRFAREDGTYAHVKDRASILRDEDGRLRSFSLQSGVHA